MPGPDSALFGGPGIGTVVTLFNAALNTPDSNSTTNEQIRLAREAGYSGTRPQLIAIGQGLMSQQAFALGQGGGPGSGASRGPVNVGPSNLPAVIPQPPPPFNPPSTTVYYPPPEPPIGGGSGGVPPSGGTPGINPNVPAGVPPSAFPSMWPYVIGQVAGPSVLDAILAANRYGSTFFDVITGKAPTYRPGTSSGPDRRTPPKPPKEPIPPGYPPITIIVQGQPIPKKEPNPNAGLGDIYVNQRRLPVPRPLPPKPPPAPKIPLWQQLLPIIGPSIFGMLGQARGARNVLRLTDPLTRPSLGPLTGPQTVTSSYYNYVGGSSGSATCECTKPKKKGRKRKRTVCYSGTYTEKASGIRKLKKRKVPCR